MSKLPISSTCPPLVKALQALMSSQKARCVRWHLAKGSFVVRCADYLQPCRMPTRRLLIWRSATLWPRPRAGCLHRRTGCCGFTGPGQFLCSRTRGWWGSTRHGSRRPWPRRAVDGPYAGLGQVSASGFWGNRLPMAFQSPDLSLRVISTATVTCTATASAVIAAGWASARGACLLTA